MILDYLGKAATDFEDIAEKRKLDIAKVIGVVRDLSERQVAKNEACRSTDAEKDLIAQELPKIAPDLLARMNARDIHADLASRGVSMRKNQGVLSVISRTRRELLLSHQPSAQAAE